MAKLIKIIAARENRLLGELAMVSLVDLQRADGEVWVQQQIPAVIIFT